MEQMSYSMHVISGTLMRNNLPNVGYRIEFFSRQEPSRSVSILVVIIKEETINIKISNTSFHHWLKYRNPYNYKKTMQ